MKHAGDGPLDMYPARSTPPPQSARRLLARALFAALLCAACLPAAVCAQTVSEVDTAPPKKFVPEEDRARLSAEKGLKDRTKLTLLLAEERLQRAATHTQSERYLEAGRELGIYQALIDDIIQFVQRNGRDNDKTRDTFKRIDLALRAHVPRLETLRRTTPSDEAVHVRDCIEFVRDARTKALESFYDDTVLRLPPETKKGDMRGGSAKNGPPDAPEKKPDQN